MFLLCMCVLPLPAMARSSVDEEKGVHQHLNLQWDLQRESVQTARIKFSFFQLMGNDAGLLSVKQVEMFCNEIVACLDRGGGEREVAEITSRLNLPDHRKRWRELEVIISGDRVKNLRSQAGDNKHKPLYESVFDGTHGIHKHSDIDQINIHGGPSPQWLADIHDFMYVPSQAMGRLIQVDEISDLGFVRLSLPSSKTATIIVAERDSGFVTRFSKQGYTERFHLSPSVYESGVIFPKVSANVRIRKKKPYLIHIYYTMQAEFNQEVNGAEFKIAVAEKSTLVDEREGKEKTYYIKQQHDDAIEALEQAKSLKRQYQDITDSGLKRNYSLLGINVGIVCILLGVLIYRRTR